MNTDREIPYALFRNYGREVRMTEKQYRDAERVARICRCGECDCCRALEYVKENSPKGPRL